MSITTNLIFVMPIYEYQCQACETVSDFLQKMSDAPMLTCPQCEEDELKKLVSAPRFKLAGTGWYETDFKNKDSKSTASKGEAASTSSDIKKSETKTESPKTESPKAAAVSSTD